MMFDPQHDPELLAIKDDEERRRAAEAWIEKVRQDKLREEARAAENISAPEAVVIIVVCVLVPLLATNFGLWVGAGAGFIGLWITKQIFDEKQQAAGKILRGAMPATNEYPLNWDEIRAQVLVRDKYTCQNCGKTKAELHVHHIVPLRRGGGNHLSNLVTVCKDCHGLIHPHMM